MKRLIILIIALFMPVMVEAATTSISCPAAASIGQTITCSISVSHPNLNGVSLKFATSGVSFVSCNPSSIFNGSRTCQASGAALTTTNATNGGLILTASFKINAAATIGVNSVEVSDAADKLYSSNNASAAVRILSSENTLTRITIGGQVFNNPSQTINLSLNEAQTNILAVAPSAAKVSGAGVKTLNYGLNKFVITSTSESGIARNYTITITRADTRSTNNNLKNLTISTGVINFTANTTYYKTEVATTVTSVNITASLADPKARFVSYPQSLNLNYGSNSAHIKVQAENGAIKTYTIEVVRKDERSSDTTLQDINITGFDIDFTKDKNSYDLTVPFDTEKLTLETSTSSDKAKYVVENPDLKEGLNVVSILVTAENGATNTYKINVIRSGKGVKLSDDNYIKDLKIAGYDLSFKSKEQQYSLTIDKDYDLNIEVKLSDPKAKYEISGNKNLKDQSKIRISVLSESSKKRVYEILIKQKSETPDILLFTLGFISGLIVTIIVDKLILKSLKKKDK